MLGHSSAFRPSARPTISRVRASGNAAATHRSPPRSPSRKLTICGQSRTNYRGDVKFCMKPNAARTFVPTATTARAAVRTSIVWYEMTVPRDVFG